MKKGAKIAHSLNLMSSANTKFLLLTLLSFCFGFHSHALVSEKRIGYRFAFLTELIFNLVSCSLLLFIKEVYRLWFCPSKRSLWLKQQKLNCQKVERDKWEIYKNDTDSESVKRLVAVLSLRERKKSCTAKIQQMRNNNTKRAEMVYRHASR